MHDSRTLARISWETIARSVLLTGVAVTFMAAAKIPFVADVTPVIGRFSTPRAIAIVLLSGLAFAAWLIALGRGELTIKPWKGHFVTLSGMAAVAASTAASAIPELALAGGDNRALGMFVWLSLGIVMFLMSQLVRSRAHLAAIARTLIACGTVQSLIAVAQVIGLDPLRLELSREMRWMLSQGVGTAGNPNFLASLLVVPFVLACVGILTERARWARIASVVAAASMAVSLFAANTRGAWVGVLVGIIMLVATPDLRARMRSIGWGRLLVACALILAVGFAVTDKAVLSTRFDTERAKSGEAAVDAISNGRTLLWRQALDVFASAPVLGVGPDSLQNAWRAQGFDLGVLGVLPDDPHNLALLVLDSFGILGATATVALVGATVIGSVTSIRDASTHGERKAMTGGWLAAGGAAAATSMFSVGSIPLLLAMATVAGALQAQFLVPSDSPLRARTAAYVLAAIVLAATVASTNIVALPLVHAYRLSTVSWTVPLTDHELTILDAADRALPWRDTVTQLRFQTLTVQATWELDTGLTESGLGAERLDSLMEELDRRVERYPAEYTLWLARARAYYAAAYQLSDDEQRCRRALETVDEALAHFPGDIDLEYLRPYSEELAAQFDR